jgi:octaprenyl-diphosphate synthase
LNRSSDKEASRILKYIKSGEKNSNVGDIIEFVIEKGGIDYAEKSSLDFADKAREELQKVNDTKLAEPLLALLDFVVTRRK